MKQQLLEIRKTMVGLLVAGTILIFSLPASAKSTKDNTPVVHTIEPQIKFIGNLPGYALFNVSLQSENLAKFEITISHTDGTVFYRQPFEASNFSKTFKLANEEELLNNDLIFSIKNLSDGATQNFLVRASSEMVRTVVITKNK